MLTRIFVRQLFLLWVVGFGGFVDACAQYRHRSEAEIAAMTPAQRVDEYANEQEYHKYNASDAQHGLISKYLRRDGLKALPRIIEILDGYNPGGVTGQSETNGERFDAMWMLLGEIDDHVVRLRVSSKGRQAMDALERSINRMRTAGYGRNDKHEWAQHGRFELASIVLREARGLNSTDAAIQDTFRVNYKIRLSNRQLLAFTNSLVAGDPSYPSWSETDYVKDYSRVNSAGNPAQVYVMKEPDRFYQVYLRFKKDKL
jgi:hypothetical protein